MEAILDPLLLDNEDHNDDDIDDLLVMHILHGQILLGNRANIFGAFDLALHNNTLGLQMFRFTQEEVRRLARVLRIPDPIIVNRVTITGMNAIFKHQPTLSDLRRNCVGTSHFLAVTGLFLVVVLRRLTYPNRLVDLEPVFGYSNTVISGFTKFLVQNIEDQWGAKLDNLGSNPFFNQHKLRQFAQAIFHKGCPLHNCWAFIDGTCRAICRPTENQEEYYSGHKKMHCLKYQSVLCPDGIIISLKGAYYAGRRHDAGILRESGFLEELQNHVVFPDEEFVLYGDEGYALHALLERPFTINQINQDPERQMFNNLMRSVRVSVEWGFGKIIQLFAFLDFKKNQKNLWQDVSQMYRVGTILTNCHTCLKGGNVPQYFATNPPQLEEYLQ